MKPYIAQAAKESSHGAPFLPKFPLGKISMFLKSKRNYLAQAPDADMVRLAKSLSGFGDFLARSHASCNVEAGVVVWHVPNLNQPIQPGDDELFAGLMTAVIFATRAGIDDPVSRDTSAARALELDTLFRNSLPPKLQQSLDATPYSTNGCDVEVLVSRYRWIAALPAADAANYLAIQFSGQSPTVVALP